MRLSRKKFEVGNEDEVAALVEDGAVLQVKSAPYLSLVRKD